MHLRLGILCRSLCAATGLMLLCLGSARADRVNFPPSDFDILSADSGARIGIARYTVDESGGRITLHGENRYFDGQRDVEEAQLTDAPAGAPPRLLSFRHDFYDAAGAVSIAARVDVETGLGVCGKNVAGKLALDSEEFQFPDDTYAGASVLLPIQQMASRRESETLNLHVFNCAPGPKVIAVEVAQESAAHSWSEYPGELEKIDVKPDFGFWTMVIERFIPKLAVWFDPAQGTLLVGARLQRYYRGPKIIMVRKKEAEIFNGQSSHNPPATLEVPR
ncbi:MAG TPA: hypothetical protein VMT64_11060 [Candidatus Binataceae bacterium]|nr:hypothetical protein [Candidatus Binataceae bacterium]